MENEENYGVRHSNVADIGRDEMNLAEFPVAVLADRAPAGLKSLVFEDQVWDQGQNRPVTRRVTVAASDTYGLPTALDDEVLVGLIQLTRRAPKLSRQVFFSRYQFIDLLGWRREGKSYRRLEMSLKRWAGVTLYYDNAWWDKLARSWVNESFHVLEQVTLYDGERLRTKQRQGGTVGLSSFTWNALVFDSFQAGYLKRLDLAFYRSLRSAIAKRMYRFLDKRFYHRIRWTFDLREFACEHIGLSRVHDNGQIKRKLRPAIDELETAGFLEPLNSGDRFIRLARGKWDVAFVGKPTTVPCGPPAENRGLCRELASRGVTGMVAERLVAAYPAARIREKIELVDWIRESKKTDMPNPGGYLAAAIRENFSPPSDFESKAQCAGRLTREKKRRGRERLARRLREAIEDTKHRDATKRVQDYLASLPVGERRRLEEYAVAKGPKLLRQLYDEHLQNHSGLAEGYRSRMIEKHVMTHLRDSEKCKT